MKQRKRPDYQTPTKRVEVRLDLRGTGNCWLREVWLLQDSGGRRLRIDDEVYDLGSWINLPLSQTDVEAIFRALAAAVPGLPDVGPG